MSGNGRITLPVGSLSQAEAELGFQYLQTFLKKVRIEREKNVVQLIQVFELPDEETAKIFAQGLANVYGGSR
ncbi:MAG: hypothetical protein ACXQTI_08780 [Candidatus Nezhaarchaeales archaeon]